MESTIETNVATKLATRVAGEDIQPGDYVTALSEIVELPSYLWCCSGMLAADELVRMVYKPRDAGQPFKVIAVCLPFVYTELAKGGTHIFDTRKHQLVRLSAKTGRKVWKAMRRKN